MKRITQTNNIFQKKEYILNFNSQKVKNRALLNILREIYGKNLFLLPDSWMQTKHLIRNIQVKITIPETISLNWTKIINNLPLNYFGTESYYMGKTYQMITGRAKDTQQLINDEMVFFKIYLIKCKRDYPKEYNEIISFNNYGPTNKYDYDTKCLISNDPSCVLDCVDVHLFPASPSNVTLRYYDTIELNKGENIAIVSVLVTSYFLKAKILNPKIEHICQASFEIAY